LSIIIACLIFQLSCNQEVTRNWDAKKNYDCSAEAWPHVWHVYSTETVFDEHPAVDIQAGPSLSYTAWYLVRTVGAAVPGQRVDAV
jgi:hypothetical protein